MSITLSRPTRPEIGNRIAESHLDWAKICARAGEYDAAIENLESALAAGYTDTSWWPEDPDLCLLETDDRFKLLVERGARRSIGA